MNPTKLTITADVERPDGTTTRVTFTRTLSEADLARIGATASDVVKRLSSLDYVAIVDAFDGAGARPCCAGATGQVPRGRKVRKPKARAS